MSKRQQKQQDDRNEAQSDSDAPEEESNVATRRSIKSIDKSRKAPKRSTAKVAPSLQLKQSDAEIVGSKAEPALAASAEASSSSSSPSHLLDPSLFAASFAKKRTSASSSSAAKNPSLQSQVKPTKKRFGVAKGNDGQPMKRLKDGRTTVRVLQRDTRRRTSEDAKIIEETLHPAPALDPSEVLPNAKIRGFRKQRLGLREGVTEVKKSNTAKKQSRIEEDPLGLEDPAFMKGGELEGVGLAPRKNLGGKPRPSVQLRGRRTKFTPAMTKHGQALQFARFT